MKVTKIKSTELRTETASMLRGLRNGDEGYVIYHYGDIVGYVTPHIPPRVMADIKSERHKIATEPKVKKTTNVGSIKRGPGRPRKNPVSV
ncbi:MAG: hypothetical protein WC476_01540 [Phycisphaerae bacterium]